MAHNSTIFNKRGFALKAKLFSEQMLKRDMIKLLQDMNKSLRRDSFHKCISLP